MIILIKELLKKCLERKKNKSLHIFCRIGLKKWFLKRFDLLSNQITEGDWWDDFLIVKKDPNISLRETIPYHSNVEDFKSISFSSLLNNTLNTILDTQDEEIEMDLKEKSLKISFVPARHFSRRTLLDGNKSLWGGWVVKSEDTSFYFSGDTGYRSTPEKYSNEERLKYPHCPFFTQIGKIYGPFDYACIPIGPSNEINVETIIHVDPTDAINIHKDIKSKHSLPIHWGRVANFCTIEITHDPRILRQEMKKSGLPLEEFDIAYIGQVLKLLKSDTISSKEKEEKQEYQIHGE